MNTRFWEVPPLLRQLKDFYVLRRASEVLLQKYGMFSGRTEEARSTPAQPHGLGQGLSAVDKPVALRIVVAQ